MLHVTATIRRWVIRKTLRLIWNPFIANNNRSLMATVFDHKSLYMIHPLNPQRSHFRPLLINIHVKRILPLK